MGRKGSSFARGTDKKMERKNVASQPQWNHLEVADMQAVVEDFRRRQVQRWSLWFFLSLKQVWTQYSRRRPVPGRNVQAWIYIRSHFFLLTKESGKLVEWPHRLRRFSCGALVPSDTIFAAWRNHTSICAVCISMAAARWWASCTKPKGTQLQSLPRCNDLFAWKVAGLTHSL